MSWYEYVFSVLLTIINTYFYITYTFKSSKEHFVFNKKNLLSFIFVVILFMINEHCLYSVIRLVVYYFILQLLFKLINTKDFRKNVFYSTLINFYGLFIEFILSFILFFVLGDERTLVSNLYVNFVISLSIVIIWFYSWDLLTLNRKVKNVLNKMEIIISKKVDISILFILVMLSLNVIFLICYDQFSNSYIYFLSLIVINSLVTLVLLIIVDKYDKRNLRIENNFLQKNIGLYEDTIDEYRMLKHNLVNDLVTVKTICSHNAQHIIDEKIKKYEKNYEWITYISRIPEGLRGLIYLKMQEGNKKKVKFEFNSDLKEEIANRFSPKTYVDLCDILGITIDNAINATCKCKEKVVNITTETLNGNMYIKISNNFVNEIDIDKLGNKNYSTKEEKSGLGLFYVKNKKNPKIKVKNEIIDNIFITNIFVSLKTKKVS